MRLFRHGATHQGASPNNSRTFHPSLPVVASPTSSCLRAPASFLGRHQPSVAPGAEDCLRSEADIKSWLLEQGPARNGHLMRLDGVAAWCQTVWGARWLWYARHLGWARRTAPSAARAAGPCSSPNPTRERSCRPNSRRNWTSAGRRCSRACFEILEDRPKSCAIAVINLDPAHAGYIVKSGSILHGARPPGRALFASCAAQPRAFRFVPGCQRLQVRHPGQPGLAVG